MQLRIKGAKAATKDLNVQFVVGSLDVSGGVEATAEILRSKKRPAALLCLSDVLALGALFELACAGISVPQEISVMGFDDLDWAAVSDARRRAPSSAS